MLLFTEKHSVKDLYRAVDGWRARRAFQVTGPAAELADEKEITLHPDCPKENDPHQHNANLKVRSVHVQPGLAMREVLVEYGFPPDGTFDNNDNPLNRPAQIMVDLGSTTEPFDRTPNDGTQWANMPIVNSARESFSNKPTREHLSITVTYTKYRAIFPGQLSVAMAMTVNSAGLTLPGVGLVGPGQALCRGIRLVQPFTTQSQYVQLATVIELREDGFDLRLMDEGLDGRYGPSGAWSGHITDASGDKIASPIPLNARGIPLNSSYKVSAQTPVPLGARPPGAFDEQSTGDAHFLLFRRFTRVSFAALGEFMT